MRFEDIHGKKHKTFLGALKVDLRDAYAKKVRKVQRHDPGSGGGL